MDGISRIGLFLAVVKHESFSAAARSVGMTGPALSKQVQNLEEQLGVRLLHRTTRQVTLTDEGAIYAERARKALEDLSEAEALIQEHRATPRGILRVSAPTSFGRDYLTEPIASFAARYPEVQLHVDFDDRHVDLIGDGYDVAVRIGALEDSSHIARKLAPCPVPLCASPAAINRYGRPKNPRGLRHWPAIVYSKHGNQLLWQYSNVQGERGSVTLSPSMHANNAELMRQACLEGIGVALLPAFAVSDDIKEGKLEVLLPDYKTEPDLHVAAIFPQNRHLSTKTRLFIDMLSDYVKTLRWVNTPL